MLNHEDRPGGVFFFFSHNVLIAFRGVNGFLGLFGMGMSQLPDILPNRKTETHFCCGELGVFQAGTPLLPSSSAAVRGVGATSDEGGSASAQKERRARHRQENPGGGGDSCFAAG